jgi:glucosamine 6-phosphate synthetase-like amidotransferase/phosphosugar isomerase protein
MQIIIIALCTFLTLILGDSVVDVEVDTLGENLRNNREPMTRKVMMEIIMEERKETRKIMMEIMMEERKETRKIIKSAFSENNEQLHDLKANHAKMLDSISDQDFCAHYFNGIANGDYSYSTTHNIIFEGKFLNWCETFIM